MNKSKRLRTFAGPNKYLQRNINNIKHIEANAIFLHNKKT